VKLYRHEELKPEPVKEAEPRPETPDEPVHEVNEVLITKKELAYIWGCPESQIYDYEMDELNDALHYWDITTTNRIRHFIAQISHESGGGKWKKELADGWAYEYRSDLGNVNPGDGPRYKGAGYIQLTGRYNYQKFADHIGDPRVMEGVDYVANNYPTASAGFWWYSNNMNELCDMYPGHLNYPHNIDKIGARVNGVNPPNGWADREKYWKRASEVIK